MNSARNGPAAKWRSSRCERGWTRRVGDAKRPRGSATTYVKNCSPSEGCENRLRRTRGSRVGVRSSGRLREGLRSPYRGRGGGCSEGGLSERTALAAVPARGRDRYGGAHTARPNASEGSERAVLLQGAGGRDHLAYGPERNAKHRRGPTLPATGRGPTKRGPALSESRP